MAFEKKKAPSEIEAAALSQFLNASKDAAIMTEVKSLETPKVAANLSFADLMPPEEKIKKFPLLLPPALHRELTDLAKAAGKPLHEYILRTLAEKVMQGKNTR